MKKFLLLVLVVLLAGVMAFGQQLPVDDIPQNHWAYDAVRYLLETGIVQGNPDGTYQGNSPTTRYQTAVFLYRAIEYMKSSLPYLKAEDMTGFMKELDSIRMIVDSVTNNTENVGAEYQKLSVQLNQIQNDISDLRTMKSTIASYDSRMMTLENGYSSVKSSVSSLEGSVSGISSKVSSVENNVRSFSSDITSLKASENRLTQDVSDLSRRVKATETLLGGVNVLELKSNVSKNSDSLMVLEGQVNGLNSKFSAVESEVARNSSRIGTLESSLSAQKLQVSNMSSKFDSFETQLQNISADYEGFKSDILPKVTKNGSDLINTNRKIQELQIQMDAQYTELNDKFTLPTWLGVGGVVLGVAGVGVGVYALLYAQDVWNKLKPAE